MGYGLPIWDTGCRYSYLPYRYSHPGYRYGIWANDMGDDTMIDVVISHIDMGYLVTLTPSIFLVRSRVLRRRLFCRRTESQAVEGGVH